MSCRFTPSKSGKCGFCGREEHEHRCCRRLQHYPDRPFTACCDMCGMSEALHRGLLCTVLRCTRPSALQYFFLPAILHGNVRGTSLSLAQYIMQFVSPVCVYHGKDEKLCTREYGWLHGPEFFEVCMSKRKEGTSGCKHCL